MVIALLLGALVLLLLALAVGKGNRQPVQPPKPVVKGKVERLDYGGLPLGTGMFVRHWYQRPDGTYYSLTEWGNRK